MAHPPADTRSWPRRHKVATGFIALFTLSAFGHLVDGGSDSKAKDATATPTHSAASRAVVSKTQSKPQATIPSMVGMSLDDAQAKLKALGVSESEKDASPLGRLATWGDWTVVASSAKPGTPVTSGQSVTLTVLKKEEAAWFQKHPTMPAVPVGQMPMDALGSGGVLDGMSDLVQCLYPRGTGPSYAQVPSTDTEGGPGTPMLASEKAAVAGMTEGSQADALIRSIPAAGQKVRPGRLLYLLVKNPDSTDDSTSSGTSGGGDTNLNWPNHLPHVHVHHHHW